MTATMYSPITPSVLGARHRIRVRRMLWLGAGVMLAMGLAWSIFFGLEGAWTFVAIIAIFGCVGVAVLVLTYYRRTRLASYLFIAGSFLIVCGVAWVLDVPSAHEPRTIHLFLLFLALSSGLFLRDEPLVARIAVAGTCCAAFVGFAGTNAGLDSAYALPDHIRVVGTWVNTTLSIVAMYALIHVMVSDLAETSALEVQLRDGIARKEFFLAFQPQVNSQGQVLGAEVLLRWQQPQRGLVPTQEFIALAEQTGFIVPLGTWALEAACLQLADWAKDPAKAHWTLAVNVSAHQLHQADFVEQVQAIIRRTGVRTQVLKLELTESVMVHDLDELVRKMTALKALGVGFSLDDFGTGYSSLSYLKKLPLDQLKIDKSFVRDVLTDPNDAAIARTVVMLAQNMGLQVIAEGVETDGQRQFLANIGCSAIQGYLLSRPVPIGEFGAFLAAYAATHTPSTASP